ncbi:MAG: tRNA (adenosine(37)-N6)-threonylcarbamoyltransferase complex transferase subunit TsaD [bacterium]
MGIESSCDETAVSLVEDGKRILSSVVASQVKDHARYGGVLPELAARKHLENIDPVLESALKEAGCGLDRVELIAVTRGPGLMGALLVGMSYAKGLAYGLGIPLVGVNHIAAHVAALNLSGIPLPAVVLVVSGGHTALYLVNNNQDYRLLGQTVDDAAGEAYDKVAVMLGLGYPGGPVIDRLAAEAETRGERPPVEFPRSYLKKGSLDFSFSGLKTAVWYHLKKVGFDNFPGEERDRYRRLTALGFQEAVIDVLSYKLLAAAQTLPGTKSIGVGGGVSCNKGLRRRLQDAEIPVYFPPPELCTDNAAMIAALGYFHYQAKGESSFDCCARSVWPVDDKLSTRV